MKTPDRRFLHPVRFMVSASVSKLLLRLREERDKNVSAWLRSVVDRALAEEFGPDALASGPSGPPAEPAAPAGAPFPEPPPAPADAGHVPALSADELEAARRENALVGFRPDKLQDGSWGARHDAPELLPPDLVGRRIVVTDRRRRSWTSQVLQVVERTPDTLLVRDASRYLDRRQ